MQTTERLKVGDLAARTGLTVRALHHYDEIGLVSPSARTPAGHRLYSREDVERLQQVQSLRAMGMSLDEVQGALDGARLSSRQIVEAQLASLRQRMERYGVLERRLEALRNHLDRGDDVTIADLCSIIEGITTMEKYFTPEQLATLKQRAQAMGAEGKLDPKAEWPVIIPAVQAAMDRGDDPSSAAVQALAARWNALVQASTGGDPALMKAVKEMYAREGDKIRKVHGPVPTPEMFEYIERAFRASKG